MVNIDDFRAKLPDELAQQYINGVLGSSPLLTMLRDMRHADELPEWIMAMARLGVRDIEVRTLGYLDLRGLWDSPIDRRILV